METIEIELIGGGIVFSIAVLLLLRRGTGGHAVDDPVAVEHNKNRKLWEQAYYTNHSCHFNAFSRNINDHENALNLYTEIVNNCPNTSFAGMAIVEIERIRSFYTTSVGSNKMVSVGDACSGETVKCVNDTTGHASINEQRQPYDNTNSISSSSTDRGDLDTQLKILGLTMCTLDRLGDVYTELKNKWQLNNFISDPDMYKRAVKVNFDIEKAYNVIVESGCGNINIKNQDPAKVCNDIKDNAPMSRRKMCIVGGTLLTIISVLTICLAIFLRANQIKNKLNYIHRNSGVHIQSVSIQNEIGKCREFEATTDNGSIIKGVARFSRGLIDDNFEPNLVLFNSERSHENAISNICMSQ